MTTLKEVHNTYKKWLHISDIQRIDIGLAVFLTSKNYAKTRVWLIIIGASGDWKSVQINSMSDKGFGNQTYFLRKMSSKTLVSGNNKVEDLAPKLKNKVVLIPEMANILKLDPKEKAQLWGQLRDLYDGIAGGSFGTGKSVDYEDINTTFIMGSTPAIDQQILIHQDLGTRELIYRTNPEDANKKKTMQKVWKNEKNENVMKQELNKVTIDFLKNTDYNHNIKISKNVRETIETLAIFLSYMRATAEIDTYTGELLSKVYPEEPTRCLKQLKILFTALKSLDKDYSDKQALDCIKKVVMSSSNQRRLDVFKTLLKSEADLSTRGIADKLKYGYKTAWKEVQVLWNLGFLKKKSFAKTDKNNRTRHIDHWHFCQKNKLLKKLKKIITDDKQKNACVTRKDTL